MTTAAVSPRDTILALEPRLLAFAESLTRDPREAQALVAATLEAAEAAHYGLGESATPLAWLFRVLRQQFHSVERDRNYRRSRSAVTADLASAKKRELEAQDTLQAV